MWRPGILHARANGVGGPGHAGAQMKWCAFTNETLAFGLKLFSCVPLTDLGFLRHEVNKTQSLPLGRPCHLLPWICLLARSQGCFAFPPKGLFVTHLCFLPSQPHPQTHTHFCLLGKAQGTAARAGSPPALMGMLHSACCPPCSGGLPWTLNLGHGE